MQDALGAARAPVLPGRGVPSSDVSDAPGSKWGILTALSLAAAAAGLSWSLSGSLIRPSVVDIKNERVWDVWFGSDMPQYYEIATNKTTYHHLRASRHPLFAYAMTVPVHVLHKVFPNWYACVRAVLAVASAVDIVLAFLLLRLITGTVWRATVFGLLWLASSFFVFWCGAIDTYLLGQATILMPLVVLGFLHRVRHFEIALTLASAASLSMTVTNWMSGIAATFVALPFRRATQVSVNALCLVLVALSLLPRICPGAFGASLFGESIKRNMRHLNPDPLNAPYQFAITCVVSPRASPSSLTFHYKDIGSNRLLFFVTAFLWLFLLGLGAVGLWRGSVDRVFGVSLVAILCGQFALHLVYGDMPFLYAAHYGPLMILVAAHAARWWPRLAVALAGVLAPLCLLQNLHNFYACLETAFGFVF